MEGKRSATALETAAGGKGDLLSMADTIASCPAIANINILGSFLDNREIQRLAEQAVLRGGGSDLASFGKYSSGEKKTAAPLAHATLCGMIDASGSGIATLSTVCGLAREIQANPC